MPGTMKFSISMPVSEFRALEAGRRKAGRTRSQYIRDILAGERVDAKEESNKTRAREKHSFAAGRISEEGSAYGSPPLLEFADAAERKRRAVAAAGRFESGLPDLSIGHDRHLADQPAEDVEKGPGTSGAAGGGR